MRTIYYLSIALLCAIMSACAKDNLSPPKSNERRVESETILKFESEADLAMYVDQLKDSNNTQVTKSANKNSSFYSLWDSNCDSVLSTLTMSEISEAHSEGLEFEPEDKIIIDPTFAKILNPKREVYVNGEIYRYVHNGVIVYKSTTDSKNIDKIDFSQYSYLKHREVAPLGEGIKFVRIEYQTPIYEDVLETRAPIIEPGLYSDRLILKDGNSIPSSSIKMITYAKGNGDASGFQKTISSIFGTSVVAENYFDSKHRMKLRTFSQDYVVYTSVGMTVRMQQKKAGIWWRKKAQEFRYGWIAVECYYTYKGSSFPSGVSFLKANTLLHNNTNYYSKPIVLFSIPIVDYKVTDIVVSNLLKSLLQKNQVRINKWMNNNPNYKGNPYSFFSADKPNGYSVIFPQYEETAYNDGREKINWDFRVHAQAGVKIGVGSITPTFSPVSDPEKIDITRGEIYAAVKYNDTWKACVISTK